MSDGDDLIGVVVTLSESCRDLLLVHQASNTKSKTYFNDRQRWEVPKHKYFVSVLQ